MSKNNKKIALKQEKEWERIDKAVFGSEHFLEKYQKQILIAVAAVVLLVCGYLGYKQFVVKPKIEEGEKAMFKGQEYYKQGLDSLAIFGDGNGYLGFKKISTEYGSNKVGNLAKAYTGLSFIRMHKYDEALTYLKSYDGNDKIFQYLVKGAIGDCLVNTQKIKEAIPYFMDAAKELDDMLLSPRFYKKAGLAYRELKDYDKEIEAFTTIKTQYMNSLEARDADKYINEAQVLKEKK